MWSRKKDEKKQASAEPSSIANRFRGYTPDIGDIWHNSAAIIDLEDTEKKRKKAEKQRAKATKKAQKTKAANSGATKELSLKVSIPHFKWPNVPKAPKHFVANHKRLTIVFATVAVLVGVVGLGRAILVDNQGTTSVEVLGSGATKPSFATLTPRDKPKNEVAFSKVSPDGADPAYAFVDTLFGTNLKVTQQQIPDDLKIGTESQVEKIAKDFNANELLTTPNGTKVYLGQSIKGPQSAIFTKNNLLFFIVADTTVKNEDWGLYIDDLQ